MGDLSVKLPYPPVLITYDVAADVVVFDSTVNDVVDGTDYEVNAVDEPEAVVDQVQRDAPVAEDTVMEDRREGADTAAVRDADTEDDTAVLEEDKIANPPAKRDDAAGNGNGGGDQQEDDTGREAEPDQENPPKEMPPAPKDDSDQDQEDESVEDTAPNEEVAAQTDDERDEDSDDREDERDEEDVEDEEDEEQVSTDDGEGKPRDPLPNDPQPKGPQQKDPRPKGPQQKDPQPKGPQQKDPRPNKTRPPIKPPEVRPIPPEELNGPDGKPPNPFKPIPKKPQADKVAGGNGGNRPENTNGPGGSPPIRDRPADNGNGGGRPADTGRPGGPFVQPLIGSDDSKDASGGKPKGGKEDEGHKPKAPRPKEEEDKVPFVEPLMGGDDGKDGPDLDYEFDDSLAYEDMDYVIPRLPWEKPTLPPSPWRAPHEGAEDGGGDAGDDGKGGDGLLSSSSSESIHDRRRLMLADPISSLGSSGFSYVVVTATSEGVGDNMTIVESSEEAIGASILSRIRAIKVLGESPDDFDPLEVLWNVLFWSAILLAGVAGIHLVILGVLRALKVSQVPKMLHLPRIELLTFTMILPMIAAAGAIALRSDSPGTIAAGVCFGILLPFGFLIGASIFLIYAVFRPAVSKRRAVYVLSEDSPVLFMPTSDRTAGISRRTNRSGCLSGSRKASRPSTGDEEENNAEVARSELAAQTDERKSNLLYKYLVSPLFGFDSPNRVAHVPGDANISQDDAHLEWMGRGKTDGDFVKRFGLFFEDAHGPQVVRVQSRYEWSNTGTDNERNTVGGAVLVPSAEGATEVLQTFAIIFAATKMVLFAVIINAPGGVNHLAQVIALALVCLLHIAYLRICVPYRLRIELMAEIVAAVMDLSVFICGIILVAVSDWGSAAKSRMGTAMIALQAIGFLVFITVRLALALRTCWGTLSLQNLDFFSRRRKRKRDCEDERQEHAQGADKMSKVLP